VRVAPCFAAAAQRAQRDAGRKCWRSRPCTRVFAGAARRGVAALPRRRRERRSPARAAHLLAGALIRAARLPRTARASA
jgi:hypothetical protein